MDSLPGETLNRHLEPEFPDRGHESVLRLAMPPVTTMEAFS